MAFSPILRLESLAQRVLRARWWLVAGVFAVGVLLRWPMVQGPHHEGDEAVYMSLVFELEQGHGYSLQKSPLVTRGVLDRYQYDRPLFYHPPGGIALFWLMHQLVGKHGFAVAQVCAFSLFFWAMMWLARSLGITRNDLGLFLVALLAACNPILAHVTTKYWLDGPLLAFATWGAALFHHSLAGPAVQTVPGKARKVSRQRHQTAPPNHGALFLAVLAGVVTGYASLIKLTAFTMIPGVLWLAWTAGQQPPARRFWVHGACFVLAALVLQAPWEIWQWLVVGSPFPQWAGKPSASLVANNAYVRFLTLERSPWMYITKTPMVLTTMLPSIALLAFSYPRGREAASSEQTRAVRASVACFFWVVVVLVFNTCLGLAGYSKLLRYAIVLVPAAILMPAFLISQPLLLTGLARTTRRLLLALLALGVLVEVGIGIHAAFRVPHALIVPLTGF